MLHPTVVIDVVALTGRLLVVEPMAVAMAQAAMKMSLKVNLVTPSKQVCK